MKEEIEYSLSFEVDGVRKFDKKKGFSITEVIQRVRKIYPTACMFRVLKKVPVPEFVESRG